jgi:hypothetical protein
MDDDFSQIIQFWTQALDLNPAINARRLLGTCAPDVQNIEDSVLSSENVFAFHMETMAGKTLMEADGHWESGALVQLFTFTRSSHVQMLRSQK